MTILITPHAYDDAKVRRVMRIMRHRGAPTILVVDCGDEYVALEGTHRLEACARLGIAPVLIVLNQDDLVDADSLDWPELSRGEQYPASDLVDLVNATPGTGVYRIDPDTGALRS